jgi:hypothetical protein
MKGAVDVRLPPTAAQEQTFRDRRFGPRLCKKTDISTALKPHRRQLARLNIFLLEAISERA